MCFAEGGEGSEGAVASGCSVSGNRRARRRRDEWGQVEGLWASQAEEAKGESEGHSQECNRCES